jgi:hypothetical protein
MNKLLYPLLALLLFCGACEWPSPVENIYRQEVAINAVLIAGRTVDSCWITATRGITDSYDPNRMITDTAKTRIIIFEGEDIETSPMIDTLKPAVLDSTWPHDCFFGHDTIKKNTIYSLAATIVLANGDSFSLSARTRVPDQVKIDSLKVPIFASKRGLELMLQQQSAMNKLAGFIMAGNDPRDFLFPAMDGDTVYYLYGDSAVFLTYYIFPEMPVQNCMAFYLMSTWSDSTWIVDTTRLFGGNTVHYPEQSTQRIAGLPQDSLFGKLFFFNANFIFAGKNTFHVYAVDSSYYKYETFLNLPDRYTNIEGGYGYFGSATTDSISLFVIANGYTITLTDSVKAGLDSIQNERDGLGGGRKK